MSQKHSKEMLNSESLSLNDLEGLVNMSADYLREKARTRDKWGYLYQSPISKLCHTSNNHFYFDEDGVLNEECVPEMMEGLIDWVAKEKDIYNMQNTAKFMMGHPLDEDVVDRISEKISALSFSNKDLFGTPVCRLVNIDQLRFERHHKVIYQLTPGQLQTLDFSKIQEKQEVKRYLHSNNGDGYSSSKIIRENQGVYWGVSDIFKSLIGMFDSDLGKNHYEKRNNMLISKNFMSIIGHPGELGDRGKTSFSPWLLNLFSPMRYWAPPVTFSRNVFHMLFWRPVITGKDLYGRTVGSDKTEVDVTKETIIKRLQQYMVMINWFQSSKYRVTNYGAIFRMISELSRAIYNEGGGLDNQLAELGKVSIDSPLYYPVYKKKMNSILLRGMEMPGVAVQVDFTPDFMSTENPGVNNPIDWDLFSPYKKEKDQSYTVRHSLLFLRDKLIEVILWSICQAEIRSVGWVPAQHLYTIVVDDDGVNLLLDLAKQYESAKTVACLLERKKTHAKIENQFRESQDKMKDVKLNKVFGGPLELHTDWKSIEKMIKGLPTLTQPIERIK